MSDYFVGEGNKIGYLPTEFDTNGNIVEKTIKAGADIVKGQLVAISGDLVVTPATSASTTVVGVAMFDAKSGEPVAIDTEGLFKLTAGAAITAGDKIQPDDSGNPIKLATGQAVGFAINTATTGTPVYVKFTL